MKIKLNRKWSEGGFVGGGPSNSPLPPPPPPSKGQAAKNILGEAPSKPKVGFSDTILGNNSASTAQGAKKTLLGE